MIDAPLFHASPVAPPLDLADLHAHLAAPHEAELVRQMIRLHHSVLPDPPPGWRIAHLIMDSSGNVWGSATWGRSVARLESDQAHTLSLTRYALANDLPRNAATYCLARMRRDIRVVLPDITRLTSYQDAAVHHGTIYRADNWRLVYENQVVTQSWLTRDNRAGAERSLRSKWEREP